MLPFRLSLLVLLLLPYGVAAQRNAVVNVEHGLDSLRRLAPLEKLHLQLDKSNYILGDTIWYKAYVMDGASGAPSQVSGIVYVDLVDGSGELLQRSRLVVLGGSAHGEFALDPAAAGPGRFMLRAYTQWLQNFGEDYFCHRHIDVLGDYLQEWAVDLAPVDLAGGQTLDVGLTLRKLDSTRFAPQPIQAQLLRGGMPVAEQRSMVDASGAVNLHFDLPGGQGAGDLEVVLRSDEEIKARFPLSAGLPDVNYDVQFLPESGHWLADVPAVMGVKAIGRDGKGVDARGVVLAEDGTEVATFACTHRGMGRVTLPALSMGRYRARVDFPNGRQATYTLPDPLAEGVVLHYDDELSTPERFALQVLGTDAAFGAGLALVGQSRGMLCYGMVIKPSDNMLYVHVKKSDFPGGIVHFSLLDGTGKPLASRMVYHHGVGQGLVVEVMPHQDGYGGRDSVALRLRVRDGEGQPVQGNFSMAVTDNGRYTVDSLGETIRSRYLLSSELQGTIEDPGFYLSADSSARKAVDNLLLTQGWVRYDQSLLAGIQGFTYQREPYFRIVGTVKNAFGKPLANTSVSLAAVGKAAFIKDTVSDAQGMFRFDHFPAFDTLGFVIQARNRRDKSFNVGIELMPDAQPAALPRYEAPEMQTPWYVNLDSSLQRRVEDQREHLRNEIFGAQGGDLKTIMLQEVTVTARKRVRGSWNMNGPGVADQVLNETDLQEEGKTTLLKILTEKIEGFQVGIFPRGRGGKPAYMAGLRPIRFLIDGMDIDHFYHPEEAMTENDHLVYIKGYLEQYTADELQGIEVMSSMQYGAPYQAYFLDGANLVATSGQDQLARTAQGEGRVNQLSSASRSMGFDPVYIEITTRGGKGLFNRRTPGVLHFKPMPFTWPREFYRPRYTVAGQGGDLADLRATIHWEPFIITDKQGEATVSFFSADRPGSYTIQVEGLDDQGNLAVLRQQLPITANASK